MFALVIDTNLLIFAPGGRVDVQPALSGVELSILRAAIRKPFLSISALAAEIHAGYPYVYAMTYRLANRGLVRMDRNNGNSIKVSALADLLEGDG